MEPVEFDVTQPFVPSQKVLHFERALRDEGDPSDCQTSGQASWQPFEMFRLLPHVLHLWCNVWRARSIA